MVTKPQVMRREFWVRAPAALSFLVDEFGMLGPERCDDNWRMLDLVYRGDVLECRLWLDTVERTVGVWLVRTDGERKLIAKLRSVAKAAELGPPVHATGAGGRTLRELDLALDNVVGYLRPLTARLVGPEGPALMRAAGADEWTPG